MFGSHFWWPSERNDDGAGRHSRGQRKGSSARAAGPKSGAALAKRRRLAFDRLENRLLMSGDLAQEIAQLLSQGIPSQVVTETNVTVGSFLSASTVQLTFSVSQGSQGLSGTVEVSAASAALTAGPALSAQIENLQGTYTLAGTGGGQGAFALTADQAMITASNLLTGTASNVLIDFDTNGATNQQIAQVGSFAATIVPFDTTAQVDNLIIDTDGFSFSDGSISAGSFSIGTVLAVDSPSLSFSGVSDIAGSPMAGSIAVSAKSVSLFNSPNSNKKSPFSASVDNLQASYDLSTQAFSLTADDIKLGFGQILDADATGLDFEYDPSAGSPLAISSKTIALTSSIFPNASATATDLEISSSSFSLGGATLSDNVTEDIGGVLEVASPTITVSDLMFSTATNTFSQGSIDVTVGSVSLFKARPTGTSPPFDSTVDNLSLSYDLNTQALSITADDAQVNFGSALSITGTGPSFTLEPQQGGGELVTVGVVTAAVSVPELHLLGTVNNLTITNDGFNVGEATLGVTDSKPIKIGPVTIKDPTLSLTNFGYSFSQGASFNSILSVGVEEADIAVGPVTVKATGVAAGLSLQPGDAGHFTFRADTVTVALGQYVEIDASNIAFDSSPAPGQYLAEFGTGGDGENGSLSVSVTLPHGIDVIGTAQDFAIGSDGTFVALPGFGISLSLTDAGSLDWPTWLPIQVTNLGLSWPDFSDDPDDFVLDLSASVNVPSLSGTGLELSGFVQDAIIDGGLLESGKFPITSIAGAGISVGGTIFGVEVKGSLFVATLKTDSGGNPLPDDAPQSEVANEYLYGGIDAAFNLLGESGFEIRLGISQFGPLDAYVNVADTQILDPISGLAITNFHAGIDFGRTLPDITDPRSLLTDPGFSPPAQQTLTQWQAELKNQVANVAMLANGTVPMSALATQVTIDGGATLFDAYATSDGFTLDGDVLFSTDGKLEAVGDLTVGSELSLKGAAFIDLSKVASGKAQLLMAIQAPSQAPIATIYGGITFQYATQPTPVTQGSAPPQPATGLSFSGGSQSASAGGIDLNNTSYTVEFWAKRTDTDRAETIIAQEGSSGTGLQIGFDSANDLVVTSGGKMIDETTTDNDWHHWAVTFNASTGQLVLFEDGNQVASGASQPIEGASTTLLIATSGSSANVFVGSVDNVRVWNVARSASDIQGDYAQVAPTTSAGLVAEWDFTEDQGTTVADSSGNGHTLALIGSPTWPVAAASTFTITISGGVNLTIPHLPAALTVTGTATFVISPDQGTLDLNVNGTAGISPLGNLLGLDGTVHFGPTNGDGTPDIYGAFAVQPSQLSQLQSLGLNVSGIAIFRFNLSDLNEPVTLQVPGQPSPERFVLPADSTSLMVQGSAGFELQGQDWFQIDGEVDLYFGASSAGATFYAYVSGDLVIGPASSPFVEFATTGFLEISSQGLAAAFDVTLAGSQALAAAGIDVGNDCFVLNLNTTLETVNFTPPAVSDPSQPGQGNPVTIPADPTGSTTPQPYLEIDGTGTLSILSSIDLSGTFDLLVAPNLVNIGLDMDFSLGVDGAALATFQTQGGLILSHQGVTAAIGLTTENSAFSSYGIGFAASFLLEVNTTGIAQNVGGISLLAGANGPYAIVEATGQLYVGPFDLNGTFDFSSERGQHNDHRLGGDHAGAPRFDRRRRPTDADHKRTIIGRLRHPPGLYWNPNVRRLWLRRRVPVRDQHHERRPAGRGLHGEHHHGRGCDGPTARRSTWNHGRGRRPTRSDKQLRHLG